VVKANDVGVACIAPHDLRRTCAKLCRGAGGELEQIELLLGHSSVETTERDATANGRAHAAGPHPDCGGSSELFQALGEIGRVLVDHHEKANAARGIQAR
jgi:hypothetical protein